MVNINYSGNRLEKIALRNLFFCEIFTMSIRLYLILNKVNTRLIINDYISLLD